jgi:hypothetical protein
MADKYIDIPENKFYPGYGKHIFKFKGKYFFMNRDKSNDIQTKGWEKKPFIFEYYSINKKKRTLTLSYFGRDKETLEELVNTSMEENNKNLNKDTKIYVIDWKWRIALCNKFYN